MYGDIKLAKKALDAPWRSACFSTAGHRGLQSVGPEDGCGRQATSGRQIAADACPPSALDEDATEVEDASIREDLRGQRRLRVRPTGILKLEREIIFWVGLVTRQISKSCSHPSGSNATALARLSVKVVPFNTSLDSVHDAGFALSLRAYK